ncbi:MAG: fluoride efflux transporter CrcB [Bacteroidetes bacterium]|nr:fluoride efflux transporter CrcB [Bacteroidota bacterium]
MLIWLQIALGGALGAMARFALSFLFTHAGTTIFPWTVFSANVIGCFFIGLVSVWLIEQPQWTQYKPLLIVGLLGGFTTFSSFGLDAIALIEAKAWKEAIFFILGTNIAGILAVFVGIQIAR